jgi:hypothetical protein
MKLALDPQGVFAAQMPLETHEQARDALRVQVAS